mmetsp:Transcript_10532/g.24506  ORF Transcript_10532/g.24506 Transcript_10532/m.24506 type:complete len:87 (+) Transcript_10532:679-939(+)
MYQLIRTVLSDPRDEATRLYLVYANKGAGDVLLREELEELARLHAGRLEAGRTCSLVALALRLSRAFFHPRRPNALPSSSADPKGW